MPTIKLNSLQCMLTDETDKDEMFLKLNGKKIWPKGLYTQFDSGDTKDIGMELEIEEGWLEFELWDYDFLSKNDHIGTFKMKVDQEKGKFSTGMQKKEFDSTASYLLNWEIPRDE